MYTAQQCERVMEEFIKLGFVSKEEANEFDSLNEASKQRFIKNLQATHDHDDTDCAFCDILADNGILDEPEDDYEFN